MNTCKDCKHWGAVSWLGDGRFHSCDSAVSGSKETVANSVGFERTLPSDAAYTGDAENYSSWLLTGPDFGCIKWEATS